VHLKHTCLLEANVILTIHSLQNMSEKNTCRDDHVCPSVTMFQLQNHCIDFDKILYVCYATGDHSGYVAFGLLARGNCAVRFRLEHYSLIECVEVFPAVCWGHTKYNR
jgi:hypothetical protein